MNRLLKRCALCPRECGVDRYEGRGFCGESSQVRIARADLHMWEEPCLGGSGGSGAVFFSGCSLKCCFCQNHEISDGNKGFVLTEEQLAQTFLMLQSRGAENIDLVSPTHFVPQMINALNLCRGDLKIPVIYNCGGYEKPETIALLKGYVDIFLPDMKYFDSGISMKYSSAEDYFDCFSKAVRAMHDIAGDVVLDENGMMKRGVMVRHLVLPGCRHDSVKLIRWLGESFSPGQIMVSLMRQYTPMHKAAQFKELSRRTTTFEYETAVRELEGLGFDGYVQEKASADISYVPEFYNSIHYELK